MGITYSDPIANARLQIVAEACAGGTLEICSAGYAAVLASLPIRASPLGTIFGKVLSLPVPWSANGSVAGTAALARLKDDTGTIFAQGLTVGTTSAANVVLGSLAVTVGGPISITSATITHP